MARLDGIPFFRAKHGLFDDEIGVKCHSVCYEERCQRRELSAVSTAELANERIV